MKFTLLSVLALLPSIVTAQSSITIDLRNQSEPPGRHTIEFCARPTDENGQRPGHAFVVFRREGAAASNEFLAVGFGPESGKKSPLPVWGVVSNEMFSHVAQRCLVVLVTMSRYNDVRHRVESATEIQLGETRIPVRQKYHVLANDCISFLQAVALLLGLNVPVRGFNFPDEYVSELMDMNRATLDGGASD